MFMKVIFSAYRAQRPRFMHRTWEILPYIRLWYKRDTFLETGVYTRALSLEAGWLTWKGVVILQEAY